MMTNSFIYTSGASFNDSELLLHEFHSRMAAASRGTGMAMGLEPTEVELNENALLPFGTVSRQCMKN